MKTILSHIDNYLQLQSDLRDSSTEIHRLKKQVSGKSSQNVSKQDHSPVDDTVSIAVSETTEITRKHAEKERQVVL